MRISAVHGCWFIYIGQLRFKQPLNRKEDMVERSDNAFLFQWILLAVHITPHEDAFLWRSGQGGRVAPVRMLGKISVWIQPFAVKPFIYILAVGRRGRPVHQLMDLIRTRVNTRNAHFCGQIPRDGFILFRRHIPCKGGEDAVTRMLRCMTVGGIKDGSESVLPAITAEKVRIRRIHIMRRDGTA